MGADIESPERNWQNRPLAWSCFWGSYDVAHVLVKASANTTGMAKMARDSKASNKHTRFDRENFDKIADLIERHEEAQ